MIDDRLRKMFMKQYDAQVEVYGNNFPEMSMEERIEFIRWNVLAAEDELHEALGEVGWKPWASSKHINRDAYCNELIDLWHFVMNLALAVGMTADEFSTRYFKKLEKNVQRQTEGYDGLNKCPHCRRAYDDDAVKCTPPLEDSNLYYCAEVDRWLEPV